MKTLRRNLWVEALAMGLFFMVIGGLFVYVGNDAKNMITGELVTQNITLGADAVEFGGTPGVAVRDAKTADIEAKIITLHTEGKYTNGRPLRNSLNMAVMGYGVANLAMGVGTMIILMGAGTMAFVAPVLYLVTPKEEEEEEEPRVNVGAPELAY
jgi:hypothetical protein